MLQDDAIEKGKIIMDLYEGLLTRRSVRKYQDKKIDKDTLTEIIKAAQYAPSAHNKQEWEFLVVDNKEILENLRSKQRWTSFAKDASHVVFVCGNKDEAFGRDKDDEHWSFVDIDCALATQNLLLAAHAKGVGACFCGCAPMEKVVEEISSWLGLPENIRPIAIVTMGYPAEESFQPKDRFKQEKIHWDKW